MRDHNSHSYKLERSTFSLIIDNKNQHSWVIMSISLGILVQRIHKFKWISQKRYLQWLDQVIKKEMYWPEVQRNATRWPRIQNSVIIQLQNFWNAGELLILISDYLKYETSFSLRFEVFMAVSIHITIFGVLNHFLLLLGMMHVILIKNFNNPPMCGEGTQYYSNGKRRVEGMNIGCSFLDDNFILDESTFEYEQRNFRF
jgi:hypothetical protein